MILYCQSDGSCYQVSHYVCLYYCAKNTKIKCPTYDQNYDTLKELPVEQKYLDKYGEPTFPEPKARKQRKKQEKQIKAKKKLKEVPAEAVVPKKRKRRTKAEMEAARASEVKQVVPEKAKRKRRTKAEMAEAKKEQEKADAKKRGKGR